MGRRDRERIARIKEGTEEAIAETKTHNPAGQIGTLKHLIDSGMVSSNTVKEKLTRASEKDMLKLARKARQKGHQLTAQDLIKTVKENPEFLKLCEGLGLDLAFFEGLAETAIWRAKQ